MAAAAALSAGSGRAAYASASGHRPSPRRKVGPGSISFSCREAVLVYYLVSKRQTSIAIKPLSRRSTTKDAVSSRGAKERREKICS